ncbi:MAG: NHL repeat-containing protein [Cyclobacteriaceae bacterium]
MKFKTPSTNLFILLITLVLITSCGGDDDDDMGDDPTDPMDEVSELSPLSQLFVGDIANNGNASDMQVYFTQLNKNQPILEHRVLIVKSADAASYNLAAAEAVPTEGYITVPANANDVVLNSTINDADGESISEGVPYKIIMLSIATDATVVNAISPPSNEITLEQKSAVRSLTPFFNAGSGGMDTDIDGNIYMGDFGASLGGSPGTSVWKIDPLTGAHSIFARGLVGASGNHFDSQGNLFQSNIGASSVSRITPDGTVGTFSNSTLQGPVGITIDGQDNLFVANCSGNTISKISANGTGETWARSNLFNCPNGITMDNDGNLYVANFSNGDILKVTPDKEVTKFAAVAGNNNGHLLFFNDLLWVVGRGGNRIVTINLDGEVSPFAGTGQRGIRNGALDQAQFSLPNDLAFSPDGKFIYINDTHPEAAQGVISPVIIRVIEIVE